MENIENQFAEQFRKEDVYPPSAAGMHVPRAPGVKYAKPTLALSKDIAIVQTHAQVARDNAIRAGRDLAARSLERCIAIMTRMIEIETEHEEQNNGK